MQIPIEYSCSAKKDGLSCTECWAYDPLLSTGCSCYGECDTCEFWCNCTDYPCSAHREDLERWGYKLPEPDEMSLQDAINYPGYPIGGEI